MYRHMIGTVNSPALMRMMGMAPPPGCTTLSTTNVTELTRKWLEGSMPEADPSMMNSNGLSGVVR
jgi:hypothetical protein